MQLVITPSITQILNAICDIKSLNLFNAIAVKDGKTLDMRDQLSLSHKEFYSRISKLIRIGMIKCTDGKYSITAFGRVIHEIQLTLEGTVEGYSEIKKLGFW
ncbi:MAG TPA: hypothetical protein VF884_09245 [Nitrososphaeraceae archaeon]